MKRKHIFLSAVLFPAVMAFAQQNGGMWIPTELNEKEMKDLGMKISAKQIFDPSNRVLKMLLFSLMVVARRKLFRHKVCFLPIIIVVTDKFKNIRALNMTI